MSVLLKAYASFLSPWYKRNVRAKNDCMIFDKLAAAWSGTELDTCITAKMQRLKKGAFT